LYRIIVDQGGTFADGVLVDDEQKITVAKVETGRTQPDGARPAGQYHHRIHRDNTLHQRHTAGKRGEVLPDSYQRLQGHV
jgi:N-methylhydantoinase A/oxoprolinase/acetone carboxylase beta subunit